MVIMITGEGRMILTNIIIIQMILILMTDSINNITILQSPTHYLHINKEMEEITMTLGEVGEDHPTHLTLMTDYPINQTLKTGVPIILKIEGPTPMIGGHILHIQVIGVPTLLALMKEVLIHPTLKTDYPTNPILKTGDPTHPLITTTTHLMKTTTTDKDMRRRSIETKLEIKSDFTKMCPYML